MPKQKINIKDRVEYNSINLSLSELTEVPFSDIAIYKQVINLDLSNNKITILRKNIELLSHIVKLDLSKNLIKVLPHNFGNLKSLRYLDLYNNRLENLPLSFGNLSNLRYLDLKANPLNHSLERVVGPCLTTNNCKQAAKNAVKFLKQMEIEFETSNQKLKEGIDVQKESIKGQKCKKLKKKTKIKFKKSALYENDISQKDSNNYKLLKSNLFDKQYSKQNSNTALKTILAFFILLALNIFAIYVITFKNPEIAEKIVEFIPAKYQEMILSKTESMKLKMSDYLQQFRTADEDYSYMKTKNYY